MSQRPTHRTIPDEFPEGASEPPTGLLRRELLQMLGISLAIAAGGCFRTPTEDLVPYGERPKDIVPGVPLHYATAFSMNGYGMGLVVESHQGRPTKVEGNTEHPASLGAANIWTQALTAQLYYPYRLKAYLHRGAPMAKDAFIRAQVERGRALDRSEGEGLRFLLEPTSSPTVGALLDRIFRRYPRAKAYAYDVYARDNLYEGARLAFGRPLETVVDMSKVRVVVALDADFLGSGPSALSDARRFVETRAPGPAMSRLFVVESTMTITGMFADERLGIRSSDVGAVALSLVHALSEAGVSRLSTLGAKKTRSLDGAQAAFVEAMARDLVRAGERGLVVAGPHQPPWVVALAHAINSALGSDPAIVEHVEPGLVDVQSGPEALSALVDEMRAGEVRTLICDLFDPAATAPVDLDFAAALGKVPVSVYRAYREDRTSKLARFVAPAATALEAWGDTRAPDGTATIVQPLILPIYGGMSSVELLAPYAGLANQSAYQIVKGYWRAALDVSRFDLAFDAWLAAGVIPGTASARVDVELAWGDVAREVSRRNDAPRGQGLAIEYLGWSKALDGSFASNGWLEELPDPVTRISWDSPARIGSGLAKKWKVTSGDIVALRYRGNVLEIPVVIVPGQVDDAVSIALGYGLTAPNPETIPIGSNAYRLRRADAPWFDTGLEVSITGRKQPLANVQQHYRMQGRELAIEADLAEFEETRDGFLSNLKGDVPKLYEPFRYDAEYQWGMAIDLNRCIGCAACVIACQAENNIPIVGAENARLGREMHWIRIDRYIEGPEERPHVITQPVMCMHCEAAPCEYVCPVNATVHSEEGLNEMVYNRCVGTRYCSNNCPYKVRRFNYLDYHPRSPGVTALQRNPEVTVRSRGVMEKCTYCVQRIQRARIDARRALRPIDTKNLQTACQQTCPTRAIIFGSLKDESSELVAMHRDARRYDLLHELGTRPRTVYLARIKNPSPEA